MTQGPRIADGVKDTTVIENRSPGSPCCTGRINYGAHVVFVDLDCRHLIRSLCYQIVVILFIRYRIGAYNHEILHTGQFSLNTCKYRCENLIIDEHPGFTVVDYKLHLRFNQADVDGNHYRPGLQNAEINGNKLLRVAHHHGDAVPFTDAEIDDGVGDPIGKSVDFPVV